MRKNRNKVKYAEFKEEFVPSTLVEKQKAHQERHPNDKNIRKVKGITWSKKTEKDKELKQFYKTHVWTSFGTNGWIALPVEGEEE